MIPFNHRIQTAVRAALAADRNDDDRPALWRAVYRSANTVANRLNRYNRDMEAADVVDTWCSWSQERPFTPREQDEMCGLLPLSREMAEAGIALVPLNGDGDPFPDEDDPGTITEAADVLPIDEADAQRHRDRALLASADLPHGVYGSTLPEPHETPDYFPRF